MNTEFTSVSLIEIRQIKSLVNIMLDIALQILYIPTMKTYKSYEIEGIVERGNIVE